MHPRPDDVAELDRVPQVAVDEGAERAEVANRGEAGLERLPGVADPDQGLLRADVVVDGTPAVWTSPTRCVWCR